MTAPGVEPGLTLRRGLVSDAEDAAIRALLRGRPMAGAIRVALTREPDSRLATAAEGERPATVLLADERGRLLGFATRAVRELYLGGKPTLVGYLGQLRLVDRATGLRRLRQGFELLRDLRAADEASFDLTAILADNLPARRLLERGLPGLPRYLEVAELVTLVLPVAGLPVAGLPERGLASGRPPSGARRAGPGDRQALLGLLERELSGRTFAPVWRAEHLEGRGSRQNLALEDFWLLEVGGRLVGAGAIWDQRGFRQAVVAGYAPALRLGRPLLNLGLGLLGQPLLPRPGTALRLASVAGFVVAGDEPELACRLLAALLRDAHRRGLGQLALSLAAGQAMAGPLRRRFRARPYRSRLYAVAWPDDALPALPAPRPYVEAGLL